MGLKALVIGAGAVGQVFGHHLARGGAELTYYVREKYRAEVSRGFDLYRLPRLGRGPATKERLEGYRVIARADEVTGYDQVYVTLAADAMRGPWLAELAPALGDATIVALQPSAEDRTPLLDAGVAPERIVSGLISLVAYAGPLAGELPEPGMAFWLPPLSPCLFSGPRAPSVVEALSRGGLPARLHPDVPRFVGFPTAMGMAVITGLEAAGWSLDALLGGPLGATTTRALREAKAIVELDCGRAPPAFRVGAALASPALLRLAVAFGRRAVPFPLEPYLAKHFTKVRAQTRMIVGALVARGRAGGRATDALEALASSVPS